jgi:hypothetical protein
MGDGVTRRVRGKWLTVVRLALLLCFATGIWRVGVVQPLSGVQPAAAQHNRPEANQTPTPAATSSTVQYPDDAETVSAETALQELTAKNEAIKSEFPQLAKVDDQAFSGGNLDQISGAPNGDNFGRVTPSKLGRGGGLQNMTNQLMQQAFQAMMKQKPAGGGAQQGQGRQVAKKQPAKSSSTTATADASLTPAATVTAAQTPQGTSTPGAEKTETPAATPTPAPTVSTASSARVILAIPTPAPTPRPATAQWRAVRPVERNPYRF